MPDNLRSFLPAGYNPMQAQLGLLPGGIPAPAPMQFQPPPMMHPGMVSGMLQQQQMQRQYAAPMAANVFGGAPLVAPPMMGPGLPPPMFGGGLQARQRGIEETNRMLGLGQAGVGLGARGLGLGVAGMLGGPLGMMAYEGLGIGQGMQRLAGNVFEPIIAQRERALGLQSASTHFMTGGSGLSASGHGLSMASSNQVISGVNRMTDSASFRRDTGNMFNRADMDRITRLSGELGMLSNAQSADQMIREVKNVSKALSSFMKLADEPDIQAAMKQMGRLRSFGMSTPEITSAASNARTFARMAGVSVQEAMQGAERGAGTFMQAGLSGAAGFQAGLGAQGMARQLSNTMTPRQLAMAGGQEGVESTMLGASAHALTMDALMTPALVRRNGQLTIDRGRLGRMTGMNIQQRMQAGAQNIQGLGGRAAIEELSTRRRELQDEMAQELGPEGMNLYALNTAVGISRSSGMGLGASLRTMGLSEQQARTLEQLARNPDAIRNIEQQMRTGRRERATERRREIGEHSGVGGRLGHARDVLRERASGAFSSLTQPITDYLADDQDMEEIAAASGGGPYRVVRRSRLGSDVQSAGARDMLRDDPTQARALMQRAAQRSAGAVSAEDERVAYMRQNHQVLGRFFGPQGFGFTEAGRGGMHRRDVIMQGADVGTRLADVLGYGPSASAVNRMGESQEQLSAVIERSQSGSVQQRMERAREASNLMGGMPAGRGDAMRGALTSAIQSFTRSRTGLSGLLQGTGDMNTMRSHVEQQLRRQGFSAEEVRRATGDQRVFAASMESAQASMSSSERQVLNEMREQGGNVSEARTGQSLDALREHMNTVRDSIAEDVGLNIGANASDTDKRTTLDLLQGTGDEADLRRKLLAAFLMTKSSDEATVTRGQQRIEELRRGSRPEVFDRVLANVRASVSSMDEGTQEDLASRVEGKTSSDAESMMQRLGSQATEAQADELQAGLASKIGDRAAALYSQAGGGAGGVRALRDNTGATRGRLREMLESGASDTEVQEYVERQAAAGTGSTEMDAAGAAVTEGEEARGELADSMVDTLREHLEDMPTAAGQLSEAARRLNDVADRLADAGSIDRITRLTNGAGD